MRSRPLALLSAALLASVVATATPTGAAGPEPRAPEGTRLSFAFDDDRALRPDSEVRSVPRRASGRVVTDGAAQIGLGQGVSGRAARFPCLTCGRAIIEVPHRKSLTPRDDILLFGASVRVTPTQGVGSMNVLQKGWHDEVGGQFKLQIDDGRPSCVVAGSEGRVVVQDQDLDVADGEWHQVTCRRRDDLVFLLVDGYLQASASGGLGQVTNTAPVWVGGKEIGTGDPDQFRGRMDDVFVRIKR